MTNEQRFFLKCLSDHIHLRKTEECPSLCWEELASVSNQQQVGGIVYYQCRAESGSRVLQPAFVVSAVFAANRASLNREVFSAFSRAHLPFIVLKGGAVSELYPVPALRTMGDTDILVHSEDKERAHTILLDLGFDNCSHDENEWVYRKNGLEFELHHNFCHDRSTTPTKKMKQYAEHIWDYVSPVEGTSQYVLDWSDHIIFLLLHLRQHFLGHGVGVRMFLDLAVAARNGDPEWDRVRKTLEEADLLQFAKTCFSLCNRWFDTDIPISCELTDDFFEKAAQQTLTNGVFGGGNQDSSHNYYLVSVRGEQKKSRFSAVLSMFFPTYKEMCSCPGCRFVIGRPYLLPAAWIRRGLLSVRRGNAAATAKKALSPYLHKKAVAEQEKFLQQFGI